MRKKDALCDVRLTPSALVFCFVNTLFLLCASLMTLYFAFDLKLPSISTSFLFLHLSSSLPDLLCIVPYDFWPVQQINLEIATKSSICILKFRDLKVVYELKFSIGLKSIL